MKYLYTLPSSIIVLTIIISWLCLFIHIVYTCFSIISIDKNKKRIIKTIYNISVIIYIAILVGTIASVERHLTEGTIAFDYYLVIRYFGIIISILGIAHVIINKSFKDIIVIISGIILLPCFEYVFKNAYAYIFIIFISIHFIYSLYLILTLYEFNQKNISILSIKEALDSLPIGICFADNKKKIIFNNKTMFNILKYNDIDSRIKVSDLWNEIKEKDELFDDENTALLKYEDDTFMVVLDKSNDLGYQIKATSIKNEYKIIEEIMESNKILEEQEQALKDNILKLEDIERTKSLLRIKGRIHDIFAQRLSIIHQYLDNENITNISNKEIKELLTSMTKEIKEESEISFDDVKNNIISSYELIGMKITIDGNLKESNAILKIIREAATNALRHGGATELLVEAKKDMVIISNNGIEPKFIKEGNGIKNMKFIAKENDLDIEFKLNPYQIIIK